MNSINPTGPTTLFAMFALLALSSGCKDEVHSEYGFRSGYFETSLNGTRVLGDMFAEAGHRVRSWTYLSPSLENADVIVWLPNDFEPPTSDVEAWLTHWLTDGDPSELPRVLIYVGRDFDAAPDYWQRMQTQPPPRLKAEYARRLSEAQADAAAQRPATLSRSETNDWFQLDDSQPPTKVQDLGGPWAVDVDGSQTEIERNTRLVPLDDDYTTLLADENGEPLVSEYQYVDYDDSPLGRLIMIENGSWLLNAPLVNHEHRKLAGRLVDSIGPPPRTVVFLESQHGGPPIRDTDPSTAPPTGLQLFRIWPIGAVLAQLAALGVVLALMKWPVFGTPRRLKPSSTTDFASHIVALGRLLRYGRDRSHATELLRVYRQSLRREAPPISELQQATPEISPQKPNNPRSE
jgi:hypothetical protein